MSRRGDRPVLNRSGEIVPWTAKQTGEDAAVWNDDSFEVFLGDAERSVHLGLWPSAAATTPWPPAAKPRTKHGTASGSGAVTADADGLAVPLTIPWKTLADAGLKPDRLGINCQMNQKDTSGEPAISPGTFPNPKRLGTSGEADRATWASRAARIAATSPRWTRWAAAERAAAVHRAAALCRAGRRPARLRVFDELQGYTV